MIYCKGKGKGKKKEKVKIKKKDKGKKPKTPALNPRWTRVKIKALLPKEGAPPNQPPMEPTPGALKAPTPAMTPTPGTKNALASLKLKFTSFF